MESLMKVSSDMEDKVFKIDYGNEIESEISKLISPLFISTVVLTILEEATAFTRQSSSQTGGLPLFTESNASL